MKPIRLSGVDGGSPGDIALLPLSEGNSEAALMSLVADMIDRTENLMTLVTLTWPRTFSRVVLWLLEWLSRVPWAEADCDEFRCRCRRAPPPRPSPPPRKEVGPGPHPRRGEGGEERRRAIPSVHTEAEGEPHLRL